MCVNGVLKRRQRKCKSITDVIKILQDYVKEQDTPIQLSLMGQGEWQLLTGDWNISEIEFYSKTPTQNAAFLKGVNATIPNSSTIDNSNQQSNKKCLSITRMLECFVLLKVFKCRYLRKQRN